MFSLLEVKKLITLILAAIACVSIYFIVKGGALAWLTGKPCKYGDIQIANGQTYKDTNYDLTVKCEEGKISYIN